MNMCLMPQEVDKFVQALKDGRIKPEELGQKTSEERHKFFADIVGEGNAKLVNSNFESKMLLKNQKYAYTSWAKKVAGLTPEVKRDLLTRIERLDHVLSPVEEKTFLKDLASTRLGIDVTHTEAKTISDLSQKVQTARANVRAEHPIGSPERMAHGYAVHDLGEYVNGLKHSADRSSLLESARHPIQSTSKVAGIAKSIKASLDNSALFRQGWKTLLTNPKIWQKNARQSFVDIVKEFGAKDVMREVNADILSRPNYEKYKKMGLDISNIEEAYPSTVPEKIPVFRRLYKASESAYTGFLYRQRADIADKYLEIAEKSNVNINDKEQLKSIGKLVNSLTGRGDLGRLEGTPADYVNNVFFSLRFLKSNFDTLTAHQLQKSVTPFVRKQAAVNLLKIISGTAAILGTAELVKPGSVEFDPRSKDFGKIKIGDTRFDVSGGMSSIATLATQLLMQETKSGTTGVVSKLNSGFGSQTGVDVVNNFFENKLSPAASVLKDIIKQQDFNGQKPTLKGEATNFGVPLPITTFQELKSDPHAANAVVGLIADGLGIATNTYGKSTKNYALNASPTLQAFHDYVGDDSFKKANQQYNTVYDNWFNQNRGAIDKVPNDEKQGVLTAAKTKIQNSIYKQYGFKKPKANNDKAVAQRKKTLLDSIK